MPATVRLRNDAWRPAISSAAGTPFPATSPIAKPDFAGGSREEVEIVAADGFSRQATPRELQSGHGRSRFREESLLHLACDFEFVIDAFALRSLLGDRRRETADLQRKSRLIRNRFEQADVAFGIRLLGTLGSKTQHALQLVGGPERQKQLRMQLGKSVA